MLVDLNDNSGLMSIRPIFVLGSPRSGTTMIGNYIGSAPSVLNTGEYRALYLTHGALPMQLHGGLTGLVPAGWEAYRDRYIREAQRHSIEFITRAADQEGRAAFVDSFPRNLMIAPQLMELFPDALFVLTLRHYTGTVQSLMRLGTIQLLPGFEKPIDWVDPTAVGAARIWSHHYQAALQLPDDRTIAFGYDRFCSDPYPVLAKFKEALSAAGFPVSQLDDSVFATSHGALVDRPRPTVGSTAGDAMRLGPVASFDPPGWTGAIEAAVQPEVTFVDAVLRDVYPADYESPAGYRGAQALIAESRGENAPTS